VLGGVTCIAQDTPRTQAPPAQEKSAVEVDLTGAHLDKRKFLLGIPLLGKSLDQDVEVLRKLTGHQFDPKPQKGAFPGGEKRYQETAPLFKTSPMLINGSYSYRVDDKGRFHSSTGLVFDAKAVCITVEDLASTYGPPTRIVSVGETRHGKGLGPSYVSSAIYYYSSGGRAVFAFSTAVCANDLTHSSTPEAGRPQ